MIMLNYLVAGIFIICLALTAGSIFLVARLRNQYHHEFLSALLFLVVFYFMFGFYSLWGQFIFATLVQPYIQQEVLSRISDIAILLGIPFLVFAWLMQFRFALEYTGKSISGIFIAAFLLINTTVIIALVLYLNRHQEMGLQTFLKYYYILASLLFTAIPAGRLVLGKRKQATTIMASGWILSTVLQGVILLFFDGNIYLALVFFALFFASGAFLPVYLNYSGILGGIPAIERTVYTLDEFWEKFEISPREREIVMEICNGLTNQQIADKLFISLQTVKDHTHRIYSKVDVSSRVQLVKLINESAK